LLSDPVAVSKTALRWLCPKVLRRYICSIQQEVRSKRIATIEGEGIEVAL